jgi:ABC-type transporter MlaC component
MTRTSVLALMLTFLAADAVARQTAKERTEGLIEAFRTVRKAESGASLTAEERATNREAFLAIDRYFDYGRLVDDPIAPHEAELTAAQLERYRELFHELIRTVAYPDAGSFFREARITLTERAHAGGRADVEMKAYVPRKDMETNVTFHWEAPPDQELRLVDVSFDGASLVKDYQNQFARILGKEGADGLLERLAKRLGEERKRYGTDG